MENAGAVPMDIGNGSAESQQPASPVGSEGPAEVVPPTSSAVAEPEDEDDDDEASVDFEVDETEGQTETVKLIDDKDAVEAFAEVRQEQAKLIQEAKQVGRRLETTRTQSGSFCARVVVVIFVPALAIRNLFCRIFESVWCFAHAENTRRSKHRGRP